MKKIFIFLFYIFVLSCNNKKQNCELCNFPLFVSKSTEKWKEFDVHRCKETCNHRNESLDIETDKEEYAVRYALSILYKSNQEKKLIESLENKRDSLLQVSYRIVDAKWDYMISKENNK